MLINLIIFSLLYKFNSFGIIPTKYCLNDNKEDCTEDITVIVNSLYSQREFITRPIEQSGFCAVKPDPKLKNIGQNTFADHLDIAPFKIKMGKPFKCEKACLEKVDGERLRNLKTVILDSFEHEWIIDNIPVLYCYQLDETQKETCAIHFYVGCTTIHDHVYPKCVFSDSKTKSDYVMFNHLTFNITYRTDDAYPNIAQIIEVRLTWKSQSTCDDESSYFGFMANDKSVDIQFYYSVIFTHDNSRTFKDRYRYIYANQEYGSIRWFNIILSIAIVLGLSVICAYLLVRAVRSDISRYTELINTGFDTQDEYGWKLLKGDIFRSPKYRMLLAVSVGNGFQISAMVIFSLLFPFLGFFSELARGSLVTCLIVTYILLGAPCGYISAAIYKFFDGDRWKLCVIANFFHPAVIFVILAFINFIIRVSRPATSIPFLTLFELFALWAFVSLPLNFIGAVYGFKRRTINSPVKKNLIPRSIPRQTLYNRPLFALLFGGFICFLCIYFQLHFIISSIWLRHNCTMLGLLLCIAVLLVIVCAEVSFVFCYFHLCNEDYRWQWRSFLTTSFTALYCLIYLILFLTRSEYNSGFGSFVFFGYSILMVYMLFLACGSIGFLSTMFTLRKMFASIKVE